MLAPPTTSNHVGLLHFSPRQDYPGRIGRPFQALSARPKLSRNPAETASFDHATVAWNPLLMGFEAQAIAHIPEL
jgi:hypothetical protein